MSATQGQHRTEKARLLSRFKFAKARIAKIIDPATKPALTDEMRFELAGDILATCQRLTGEQLAEFAARLLAARQQAA
jgi:hypothetical protein